jgi:cytochrome c peroxidase
MSDIPDDLALAIRRILDAREAVLTQKIAAETATLTTALSTLADRIAAFEARTAAAEAKLDRYLAVDKYAITRAAIADALREASHD